MPGSVLVYAAGGHERVAGALAVAVFVAVHEHGRPLYKGRMCRVALVQAHLPAPGVLDELHPRYPAQRPRCCRHGGGVARLSGAYRAVYDLRLARLVEGDEQAEVVPAVGLVPVRGAVYVGTFNVYYIKFVLATVYFVAEGFHVGDYFLCVCHNLSFIIHHSSLPTPPGGIGQGGAELPEHGVEHPEHRLIYRVG